jgi:hypothetical protein
MAFADPGEGSLDYLPCRYGDSKLVFRGPARNTQLPFCAVLGGTETYGKFIARPFPALLEEKTGRRMINFGCMNAGPDVYLQDSGIQQIITQADLTIVQIVGAANLSNRFYAVHPRRNDRFLRASPWLQTVFREVDFTDFHFTRHMLQTLHHVSPDRFDVIAKELRSAWVERMGQLLTQLRGRAILVWMADHPPVAPDMPVDLTTQPLLVDTAMIAAVRAKVAHYREVVFSRTAKAEGLGSKTFSALQQAAAMEVPGPIAHREVAEALSLVILGKLA